MQHSRLTLFREIARKDFMGGGRFARDNFFNQRHITKTNDAPPTSNYTSPMDHWSVDYRYIDSLFKVVANDH